MIHVSNQLFGFSVFGTLSFFTESLCSLLGLRARSDARPCPFPLGSLGFDPTSPDPGVAPGVVRVAPRRSGRLFGLRATSEAVGVRRRRDRQAEATSIVAKGIAVTITEQATNVGSWPY